MNETDRIPALEELIIYSKGLQNTALGQIQAKNGSYIFKLLLTTTKPTKIKEKYATENMHASKSLNYLPSGSSRKSLPTPGLKKK